MDSKKTVAIVGSLSIALFLFLVFEIVAYTAYRVVILPRAGFLVYTAPELLPQTKYSQYLSERDPVLGWPRLVGRHKPRNSPASPETGKACLSTYGDSFTYGDEVGDEDAWANVIAGRLDCRIDNFGVGGYGTDQAYLRFQLNAQDDASATILGIYPQNVMRNINQHRFFLGGSGQLGMKPRFILNDDELELVTLPTVPYSDLSEMYSKPDAFFPHETFLPDSDYGPMRFSFPYTLSTIQFLFKEQVLNWATGKPSWAAYWQPGHPTEAMEVMAGIAEQFNEACQQRDKNCLVIIYPTPTSYDFFLTESTLISQAFIDKLHEKNLQVLDLTGGIAKSLNNGSLCEILTDPENCRGHFDPRGNQIVADIVINHLRSLDWLATEPAH